MTYGPACCHGWLPRYPGPHPSLYGVKVGRHYPTRWAEYAFVVDSLDLLRGEGVVADLATGYNPAIHNLSIIEARMGFQVYALDHNPLTLNLPVHENVTRRVADLTATGLDDNSVDVITCVSTLEHLDDQEVRGFWGEARRILKPRGMLVVTADWMDPATLCPRFNTLFDVGDRMPDPADPLDPHVSFLRGLKK